MDTPDAKTAAEEINRLTIACAYFEELYDEAVDALRSLLEHHDGDDRPAVGDARDVVAKADEIQNAFR